MAVLPRQNSTSHCPALVAAAVVVVLMFNAELSLPGEIPGRRASRGDGRPAGRGTCDRARRSARRQIADQAVHHRRHVERRAQIELIDGDENTDAMRGRERDSGRILGTGRAGEG